MYKFLYREFWPLVLVFAAIASIGSFVLLFANTGWAVILSFSSFNIFLLILGIKFVIVLNKFIYQKHGSPFLVNAFFLTYSTDDEIKYKYDVIKHVQCKRPIATEYIAPFKWTGGKAESVSSKLQNVKRVDYKDQEDYDEIVLSLKKPLLYNDTAVIHYFLECDDLKKTSIPMLGSKIILPTDIVVFRVELNNKPNGYSEPAQFMKRKFGDNATQNYEIIATVPFNQKYKCYEYQLINPSVGYHYKLVWEKNK